MEISKQILTFIILVLLVILGGWALLHYPKNGTGPALDINTTSKGLPPLSTSTGAILIESKAGVAKTIRVSFPTSDAVITSPVTIKGESGAGWLFEGSASVQIVDAQSQIIGSGIITAKSDWMTNDFVPFEGTITFTKPGYAERGFIIIKNDNPSGILENSKSIKIPVRF